jgi:hypothetical protein
LPKVTQAIASNAEQIKCAVQLDTFFLRRLSNAPWTMRIAELLTIWVLPQEFK